MRIRSEHPRPVRTVEHVWIELPDGCRLAARMWLPDGGEPVPAVLDAVPYRKGDGTAARDATRYPYIAGHGYACGSTCAAAATPRGCSRTSTQSRSRTTSRP